MSRSRRIGASPSITKRARASPLRMTAVPTTIRSPGLSSTFSDMGVRPPRALLPALAEQPQHRLARLRSERERRLRELLAGVEGEQVGAFLVGVGERQLV